MVFEYLNAAVHIHLFETVSQNKILYHLSGVADNAVNKLENDVSQCQWKELVKEIQKPS